MTSDIACVLTVFAVNVLAEKYGFDVEEAMELIVKDILTQPAGTDSAGGDGSKLVRAKEGNRGEKAELYVKQRLASSDGVLATVSVPGEAACATITTVLRCGGEATKAGIKAKSDVSTPVIDSDGRHWHPSIKLRSGRGNGKASLINHTSRAAPAFHSAKLKPTLAAWDKAVSEYWARGLPEDVHGNTGVRASPWHWPNTNPDTPQDVIDQHRRQFLPVLRYFLVEGSGNHVSAHPADSLLLMSNDGSAVLIDLCTPEKQDIYLLQNFDRLVFSLRNKGMSEKAINNPLSKAWIKIDGTRDEGKQVRGAIHVRFE